MVETPRRIVLKTKILKEVAYTSSGKDVKEMDVLILTIELKNKYLARRMSDFIRK